MKKNTLAINFLKEDLSVEKKNEFMEAVCHEAALMNIQAIDAQIELVQKKISNKKQYTEEEISAFKAQEEKLLTDRAVFEESAEETNEIYNLVVNAMSVKNKDGYGNHKDVVRTVLRILGTWNNSRLVKYAIIPAFQSPALYEALEEIHVNSSANEDGSLMLTKENKEAYKKASSELESIIKNTFSLSFETEYTEKTRVKMTAADKKLLNDCYVYGFKNHFTEDEDTGVVDFKKRTVNTLVKAKKNKKTGVVTYDYSGLAKTICDIVIMHYFSK